MDATEITTGLWMGGEILPIEYAGFDVIINLREMESLAIGPSALLWMPLVDGPDPIPYWKIFSAAELIRQALDASYNLTRKVLVHCTAGHNRSGLIVGVFLITSRHMPAQEAIDLIRSKRPGALSNEVFVEQLRFLP